MDKKIIVISGPSGSGKDTLKNLIEINYDYKNLISTTTREPRVNEVNGINYNFISKENFLDKEKNGHFLEYAKYTTGHFYGKENKELEKLLKNNENIVTILETQGIKKIINYKDYFNNLGYELIIVFLDLEKEKLKERMIKRGDDIEKINERLNNNDYDYFNEIKQYTKNIYNVSNITPNELLCKIVNDFKIV